MNNLKNIIFDLGGVLLNLSYANTKKAFEELGIENFDALYTQAQQNKIFDLYETGKVADEDFLNVLRPFLPSKTSNEQIICAWNAMLLDLPLERLQLLRSLKDKYRIFLLSNTNEIHIKAFEKIIYAQHQLSGLEGLFEKTYYSSRVGMRKPEIEIFDMVIRDNGLQRNETIFFDDSFQHIEGAEKAGIKAIFVNKPNTILDYFDSSYNFIQHEFRS